MTTPTSPSPTSPSPTSPPASAATAPTPPATQEPAALYCANHPGVETLLRCNRCGKPICLRCAQLTDVGYRCKECIRGVQAAYFNAAPLDNLIAFGVALVVTAVAAPVASLVLQMGFWGLILAFMLGGAAGSVLAQIIRASIGRRRGRYLPYFALGGIILGVLVGGFAGLLFLSVWPLHLAMLIFTVLAAISAYQILR